MLRVRVPASSANLGPGFDVLAAALDVHMELEVEVGVPFGVRTDLAIAATRRNLAVRGFAALRPVDDVRFTIRSDPAVGRAGDQRCRLRGGAGAADALNGGGADLLAEAARLEGIRTTWPRLCSGGYVICRGSRAERLEPPLGLSAVLVVPDRAVRTTKARAALPPEVPMGDAVFNVSRASLLVLGLARGDLELVARGLEDRLHQPRRASLYPRSMELVSRATSLGALGATISGAGPTVLVWVRRRMRRRWPRGWSARRRGGLGCWCCRLPRAALRWCSEGSKVNCGWVGRWRGRPWWGNFVRIGGADGAGVHEGALDGDFRSIRRCRESRTSRNSPRRGVSCDPARSGSQRVSRSSPNSRFRASRDAGTPRDSRFAPDGSNVRPRAAARTTDARNVPHRPPPTRQQSTFSPSGHHDDRGTEGHPPHQHRMSASCARMQPSDAGRPTVS